jgi:hypothetical protein
VKYLVATTRRRGCSTPQAAINVALQQLARVMRWSHGSMKCRPSGKKRQTLQ